MHRPRHLGRLANVRVLAITICVPLMVPSSVLGIAVGTLEDFQDGTVEQWDGPGTESIIAGGGPLGTGDRYLRVDSTGTPDFLGELQVRTSHSPWIDNFLLAGINAIGMDLINLGTEPLEIRIMRSGNYGDWTSTTAFALPADGQWHHAVFPTTIETMTWGGDQGGVFADFNLAFSRSGLLIIRHQPGPPLGIRSHTPIASSLGVDNIVALPEPATVSMAALLCACAIRRRPQGADVY